MIGAVYQPVVGRFMSKRTPREESTLTALLREKPKRGRPRRAVSRQTVYVALTPEQKRVMREIGETLEGDLGRADVADMAIMLLSIRLEALRQAVSDRDREMPEGITALDSLYLLWDVPLPPKKDAEWTSIRLSPQQMIQLGRAKGVLEALFNANRSDAFALGLGLLHTLFHSAHFPLHQTTSLPLFEAYVTRIYL